MRTLRVLWKRLRGLFGSAQKDAELDAELASHLQMHIDDNVRAGMTPAEARRQALVCLGGIEQTRQAYRERQRLPWVETLGQDLRFGLRMLRKSPGFTAVAVLTLALGIGANTAIFNLIDALYLRPVPVPQADRLVRLYAAGPAGSLDAGFSYPEFSSLRDRLTSFTSLSAEKQVAQLHLVTKEDSGEVQGAFVSGNYFRTLGIEPILGRSFSPEEDAVPNRDAVAVIGSQLWKSRFNSDPSVLGREVRINRVPYKVIGVAPAEFHGDLTGFPVDIWIPSMMLGAAGRACEDGTLNCSLFDQIVGRLARGQALAHAEAEAQTAVVWSATNWRQGPNLRRLVARPANGATFYLPNGSASQMRLMMFMTVLLLLIACANLSGLLVARGVLRRREIAVRLSLGARRWRVVRQLISESLLLALLGDALGLGFSLAAKPFLSRFYLLDSEGFRRFYSFQFDWRVLAYSIGLSVFAGVFFGVVPAIRASRLDLISELKGSGGAEREPGGRLRQALVIGQVAFSMVLVVSAGLLARSGWELTKGTNFDPAHILVLRLRPELIKYSPRQVASLVRQAVQGLRAVPGVQSVAFMQGNQGLVWNWQSGQDAGIALPGWQVAKNADIPALRQDVSPDFFRTLGIPLLQGSEFSEQDRPESQPVAIINQALARRLWPAGSAVGHSLLIGGQAYQVIGVSAEVQPQSPLHAPEPHVYLSFWQSNSAQQGIVRMAIRVAGNPAPYLPSVRRVIQSIDRDVPIGEEMPMSEQVELEFMPVLLGRSVVSFCGLLALGMSAMGLYSALAFAVRTRSREIGVRMALGASRGDVLRLIVGNGTRLALAGIAIGLLGAAAASRLIASLLFGVRATDPIVNVGAAVLLFVVALAACYLPARRAASVDPMQALRTE